MAGPAYTPSADKVARERAAMAAAGLAPIPFDQPAANDRELSRMVFRLDLLQRRGFTEDDAGRWTDRLLFRDRDQDDRRLCAECANFMAKQVRCAKPGRWPISGVLHRCPVFAWETPST